MISGAAQADVCLLMVPADGNFTTAIQKGDHKAGEIQGQTRQHARLINLLGVKQLLVGVNKMDSDTAGYKVGGARPVACHAGGTGCMVCVVAASLAVGGLQGSGILRLQAAAAAGVGTRGGLLGPLGVGVIWRGTAVQLSLVFAQTLQPTGVCFGLALRAALVTPLF
jgi:hypothetical protein